LDYTLFFGEKVEYRTGMVRTFRYIVPATTVEEALDHCEADCVACGVLERGPDGLVRGAVEPTGAEADGMVTAYPEVSQ
jgi:hypothetical protein